MKQYQSSECRSRNNKPIGKTWAEQQVLFTNFKSIINTFVYRFTRCAAITLREIIQK